MKRLIRASSDKHAVKPIFTWGDVMLLLQKIKELEGLDISLSTTPYGDELTIGDYIYTLENRFEPREMDR